MIIKKTFELTFDEPNQHWLCADNLKHALKAGIPNTVVDVKEIAQQPFYGLSEPTGPEIRFPLGWIPPEWKWYTISFASHIHAAHLGHPEDNKHNCLMTLRVRGQGLEDAINRGQKMLKHVTTNSLSFSLAEAYPDEGED